MVSSAILQRWGHLPEHYYEWEFDEVGQLPAQATDVTRFDLCDFVEHVSVDWVRDVLKTHGVERVWELHELSRELFEMDPGMFVPRRDGTELYWTSRSMDWIMYSSHEGALTIGGEWLTYEVKGKWADWREGIEASAWDE